MARSPPPHTENQSALNLDQTEKQIREYVRVPATYLKLFDAQYSSPTKYALQLFGLSPTAMKKYLVDGLCPTTVEIAAEMFWNRDHAPKPAKDTRTVLIKTNASTIDFIQTVLEKSGGSMTLID